MVVCVRIDISSYMCYTAGRGEGRERARSQNKKRLRTFLHRPSFDVE